MCHILGLNLPQIVRSLQDFTLDYLLTWFRECRWYQLKTDAAIWRMS